MQSTAKRMKPKHANKVGFKTNKCFREGTNSEGCLGKPIPHLFEPRIGKTMLLFFAMLKITPIFFSKSIPPSPPPPPFGNIWIRLWLTIFLDQSSEKKCGFFRLCDHIHVHVASDRRICRGPLDNCNGAPETATF